jgi:multiple sugar transport system permease protein
MIRRQFLAIFLILPAVTVVIFAMLIPLGYGLVMSLFDYKLGSETTASFVFFKNYVRFLEDPLAIKSLSITLAFTSLALSLEVTLGVGMAVLLRSIPGRWSRFLGALYSMPLLVSPIIVGLIWRYLYDPTFGLVYYVLSWFGLDSVFGGLEKPGWALFSVAIADVWETTPFVLLVASAGLANIPAELYEAARIDGANAFRSLVRITLPLLKKVLLVVIIIRGTDAFRVFDIIYALTSGGPGNSTLSLSIYAFQKGFDQYEMGYAMTISIITMVALMAVFAPLMKRSFLRPQ